MDGALLFCRLEGQRHDLLLSALSRGEKWFDLSLKKNHSGISVDWTAGWCVLGNEETGYENCSIVQERGDGGCEQGGSCASSKKWSHLGLFG